MVRALAVAFAAIATLAPSCGAPREAPPTRARSEAPATEPVDALSRRLGRARQRLRERGFDETGWSRRMFLPADAGRAETVWIRRGACTTYLALSGGAVEELELALYDSDGRPAASDSVRGEGSLVHACPRAPAPGQAERAPYYLRARARGGAGAVTIRAFESPIGSALGVEGVFDGLLSPASPRDDVAARLKRSLERLRTRHMEPVGVAAIARTLEGEAARRNVTLVGGRCYVAIARGDDSIRDVALYLLDPTGAEVARDLEGRDEPRIQHCAEHDGAYVLEARAAEGSGDVGIALVVDPNAAPTPPPSAPIPVTQPPAVTPGADHPAVRALRERGYGEPRYLVRSASVQPGETVAHDVVLEQGCTVLLAAPETADMDLDLFLAQRDGEAAWSDTRITSEARLVSCRTRAEPARATVKAYGAEGTYSLVLLDAPEGATDVRRARLLEATAPFVARGFTLERVESFALVEGEERALPIEVAAGTCFLAAVAGSHTVDDVDLAIHGEGGRVLVSDTGPDAWAAASRCSDEAARFELRVKAYRGAGPVLLQLMRRAR